MALVTGAAGGIGRELARLLAARGARLVLTDVAREPVEALALERGWSSTAVEARALDVRDPGSWAQALDVAWDRWGRLDACFNVAGYLRPGLVHEAPLEEIERHLDVNVKGVMLGTRLAGERMVAQGSGHVINFGSMASLAPIPGLGLYSASKFAVRAFSLVAAQELAPRGVAVTVICPDAVRTPMLDLQVGHDAAALTFSGGRVLTPEEVARAAAGWVLERRPLEVWLPRSRGLLARAADLFPDLGFRLGRRLERKGRRAQARLRGKST